MKNLNIIKIKFLLIIPVIFSIQSESSTDFYGKINMSLAQIDEGYERETDTLNNASRIGFKSKLRWFTPCSFIVCTRALLT